MNQRLDQLVAVQFVIIICVVHFEIMKLELLLGHFARINRYLHMLLNMTKNGKTTDKIKLAKLRFQNQGFVSINFLLNQLTLFRVQYLQCSISAAVARHGDVRGVAAREPVVPAPAASAPAGAELVPAVVEPAPVDAELAPVDVEPAPAAVAAQVLVGTAAGGLAESGVIFICYEQTTLVYLIVLGWYSRCDTLARDRTDCYK